MSDSKTNKKSDQEGEIVQTPYEFVEARKKKRNPEYFKDDSKKDFERLDKMDKESLERLEKMRL